MMVDLHTHSNCSFDGTNTAAEMTAQAAARGISILALTDHCEIDHFFSQGYLSAVRKAFAQARAASSLDARVEVLAGIELGQANINYELANRILAAHPYDFVLASLHRLPNMMDFYSLSRTPENASYLLTHYFDTLYEMAQWGNFDAFAHFTYPLRYIRGEFHLNIDLTDYQEKIDRILSLLAASGKALEINTAGLRQNLGELIPDLSILRRFYALGGRFVTVGSDAHSACALGSAIPTAIQAAQAAGFGGLTIYRNRQPIFLPFR